MATNQGLIKLMILLSIAIVVLGFFGISLKSVFMKESVRENLRFVWDSAQCVWYNYLSVPANYAWNIFYNLLWRSFIENAERIKQGKLPLFLNNQPKDLITPESQ